MTPKLIAYAIGIAIIGALCWYLHHSGYKAGEAAAQAHMAADVQKANLIATRITNDSEAHIAVLESTHARALQDLDSRYKAALLASRSHPAIRVCSSASSGKLPEAASPAPGNHGSANPGHAEADAGSDLTASLLEYARDADQLRLAVQACQQYGAEINRFRDQ